MGVMRPRTFGTETTDTVVGTFALPHGAELGDATEDVLALHARKVSFASVGGFFADASTRSRRRLSRFLYASACVLPWV
jgi:hypothetical protein